MTRYHVEAMGPGELVEEGKADMADTPTGDVVVADILHQRVKQHRQALETVLEKGASFAEAVLAVKRCLERGGRILLCGNGGSAAVASHVAAVLTGSRREDRPLPAICLNESSAQITGLGRDSGYESVFSRQLEALGQPGDALVCLSTSGNSPNVLHAVRVARDKNIPTMGLTSEPGGKLGSAVDVWLPAPSQDSTCSENVHLVLLLTMAEAVRDLLHGSSETPSAGSEAGYCRELLTKRVRQVAEAVGGAERQLAEFVRAASLVKDCFECGGQWIACGNGGSSTICTHLATMCMGRPYGDRPMPVVVLSGLTPPVTALANDYEFNLIFVRQLEAFAKPGDVLLGFGADDAQNVVSAAEAAGRKGIPVIGLTMGSGGRLAKLSTVALHCGVESIPVCEVVHKICVLTLAQATRALIMPPVRPW